MCRNVDDRDGCGPTIEDDGAAGEALEGDVVAGREPEGVGDGSGDADDSLSMLVPHAAGVRLAERYA